MIRLPATIVPLTRARRAGAWRRPVRSTCPNRNAQAGRNGNASTAPAATGSQTRRERVVGELRHGARLGPRRRSANAAASSPRRRSSARRTSATRPRIDDEPGLAVDDRFVRSAAASRDRGDAARRGLEEHDPEPLGLEAEPTVATRHREDVGARVERREVGVGNPTEEPDPATEAPAGHPGLQARAVAARARDRELHRGVEPGDRVDHDVEALAGHEPAGSRARVVGSGRGRTDAGDRTRASASSGWKRSTSTPGGMHHAPDGPAGRVHDLARRVLPRRDDAVGSAQHAPGREVEPREATWQRDLGAVRDHDVRRRVQAPADETERAASGRRRSSLRRPRARARRCGAARPGRGSNTACVTRSTRNDCAASKAAAPS